MRNRSVRRFLAATAAAGALGAVAAASAVPGTITYTGELRNDGNICFNGAVAVTARLYGAASGGAALWSQDLGDVAVMDCLLQADLAGGGLQGVLAAQSDLWLEFEIDGETLAPRQKLVSVPYATICGDAATLGGMPASAYLTTSGPGSVLSPASLPTDGLNQVSNGALRNKFLDESAAAAAGSIDILDAQPSDPPPPAMKTLDTAEGPGSYVTAIAFHTSFGLDFNSQVRMVLTPPASSGQAAITLREEFLVAGNYDEMWTVDTTPELAALLGQQLTGIWTLTVTDLDNTAAGSPKVGALMTFEVLYDVVRADHLVVDGRLDVSGDINAGGTVSAAAFEGDGRGLTNISKILNITYHESTTRVVLNAGNEVVLEEFVVNKLSPTSMLLVQATISGRGEYSDHQMPWWDYGASTVAGQQYPSDNGSALRGKNLTQQVAFIGHTQTGPQTMRFRFKSNNGATGDRPFDQYNPNSIDDARLGQTTSTYLVWEIEK